MPRRYHRAGAQCSLTTKLTYQGKEEQDGGQATKAQQLRLPKAPWKRCHAGCDERACHHKAHARGSTCHHEQRHYHAQLLRFRTD